MNLILRTTTNNIKIGRIKEQSNVYHLIYIGYAFAMHHQMIYIGLFFDSILHDVRRGSHNHSQLSCEIL